MLFLNDRVHSIWKSILCARVLVLCDLSTGIPLRETTRFGCVENSYVVRPPVPQEVEPWNTAGTISCADPTARFPCNNNKHAYVGIPVIVLHI